MHTVLIEAAYMLSENIPGAARVHGFSLKSGQSTTLTSTVEKFLDSPSWRTIKKIMEFTDKKKKRSETTQNKCNHLQLKC